MTTREKITSGYYDLVSPAFQCVADAVGVGRLFEFPDEDEDGENVTILILARDSIEALELFDTYRKNQSAGLPCDLMTKQFGIRR